GGSERRLEGPRRAHQTGRPRRRHRHLAGGTVSAAMHEPTDLDHPTSDRSGTDDTVAAGSPVVVRRNAGLAALVGAGASAVAIAYLWRASASSAPLDWALCLAMTGIAVLFLANLVDARTPLLVADDLG